MVMSFCLSKSLADLDRRCDACVVRRPWRDETGLIGFERAHTASEDQVDTLVREGWTGSNVLVIEGPGEAVTRSIEFAPNVREACSQDHPNRCRLLRSDLGIGIEISHEENRERGFLQRCQQFAS